MAKLTDHNYLAFPLKMGAAGAQTVTRADHVRQQIEQVLFTNPRERVFRPEFGAGVRLLVFEPNTSALWEITRKRLIACLAEALQGEVDPKTLEVEVEGEEETLRIVISYSLATIGQEERHEILVGNGGESNG